jgi:hypothetical protein
MPAAVSPITRQTVGKTFIVAISVLGVGATAQLAAVAWLFVARFKTTPPADYGPTIAVSGAAQMPGKDFSDPFADASLPSATASPAPATPAPVQPTPPPAPPRPSPVSPQAFQHQVATTDPTQEDRFNELIDQGRLLRDRGDTYAAVTKLREAQVLDAKNPVALAELAMTYEKMGFAEKAAEYWKRIYDMGETAGVYYQAAKGKLDAAKAQTILESRNQTASNAPAGENVGLSPTSKFGLGDITRTDEPDPAAMQRFTLHIPIKAKPRARVDAKDVTVKVDMYDVVSNGSNQVLDHTKANVTTRWASPPADWADEDVETLEVTYTLLKPPQGEPLEDRKYYGHITSVYYKNALQDFRADPPRLTQKAPPPHTLSQEAAQ